MSDAGGFREHGLIAVVYVLKLAAVTSRKAGMGRSTWHLLTLDRNKEVRGYFFSSLLTPFYSAADLGPWGHFSSTRV